MRFNCGPTYEERKAAKEQWHKWFAWFPVRINGECVWLEYVERKGERFSGRTRSLWVYEYREAQK